MFGRKVFQYKEDDILDEWHVKTSFLMSMSDTYMHFPWLVLWRCGVGHLCVSFSIDDVCGLGGVVPVRNKLNLAYISDVSYS